MVPVRYVGGTSLMVVGMGMQSVFPVPMGFQMNAFPKVFGQIASAANVELWRNIAATVKAVETQSSGTDGVFATKRPHDMRKM